MLNVTCMVADFRCWKLIGLLLAEVDQCAISITRL